MGLFNTNFEIPGGYGQVITEPVNSGSPGLTTVGVVGAANSGPMEEVLTFTNAEELIDTLGTCEAVDYIRATWANQAGIVKFVRVGATHFFDEIWMDEVASSATDVTDSLSREYGSALIFDTGAMDWMYAGASQTFGGAYLQMASGGVTYASGAANPIEVQYYNGTSWTALSITSDGTSVSSQTLKQSGKIAWTAPLDWEQVSAPVTGDTATNLYWVRFRPSVAAPTIGTLASVVCYDYNALPAYGFIGSEIVFTDSITTSNAAGVTLTDNAHTGMRAALTIASGTATGTDTTTLTDTSATFVTDNVRIGDTVRNVTEGSTEYVVSIDSETQLTTTAVTDWTGDSYVVYRGYDFSDADMEIGDVVTNVTDGSTASVLSIDSADQITTTALSGGYNNGYFTSATVTNELLTDIVDATALTSVSYLGATAGTSVITCAAASFITNRTAVGDLLVNNNESAGASNLENVIVGVLSETEVVISGDATGWTWVPATDTISVQSKTVCVCANGDFVTNGVRPGQLLTLASGGTATITSVISETIAITDGISGGTTSFFEGDSGIADDISYTKTADTYSFSYTDEKVYLEAKEFGIGGRNISVQISTSGSEHKVEIITGGYTEEYTVATTADNRLSTIVSDINTNSELVTAELVSGVDTDDLPTTMDAVYLTGGSNGSATDSDYALGLEALLTEEDIGVVYVAAEYTDAINAALKSHVATAAGINYQLPRVAVCVKPEDESFLRVTPALRTEANALSYDGRTVYLIQKGTISSVSNTATGLLTSRTATAAAIAGRIASLPAATPLTAKNINIAGIDKVFNRGDKRTLITYGIMVLDQDSSGINVVRSVTTTTDSVYEELSVRRAVDQTELTVRTTLANRYVGKVSEPGILTQVRATARNVLDSLVKIAGTPGGTLRDWRNVYVAFNANDYTRIDISYEVLPLTPINFIFTSMFVHSGITFEI